MENPENNPLTLRARQDFRRFYFNIGPSSNTRVVGFFRLSRVIRLHSYDLRPSWLDILAVYSWLLGTYYDQKQSNAGSPAARRDFSRPE